MLPEHEPLRSAQLLQQPGRISPGSVHGTIQAPSLRPWPGFSLQALTGRVPLLPVLFSARPQQLLLHQHSLVTLLSLNTASLPQFPPITAGFACPPCPLDPLHHEPVLFYLPRETLAQQKARVAWKDTKTRHVVRPTLPPDMQKPTAHLVPQLLSGRAQPGNRAGSCGELPGLGDNQEREGDRFPATGTLRESLFFTSWPATFDSENFPADIKLKKSGN